MSTKSSLEKESQKGATYSPPIATVIDYRFYSVLEEEFNKRKVKIANIRTWTAVIRVGSPFYSTFSHGIYPFFSAENLSKTEVRCFRTCLQRFSNSYQNYASTCLQNCSSSTAHASFYSDVHCYSMTGPLGEWASVIPTPRTNVPVICCDKNCISLAKCGHTHQLLPTNCALGPLIMQHDVISFEYSNFPLLFPFHSPTTKEDFS